VAEESCLHLSAKYLQWLISTEEADKSRRLLAMTNIKETKKSRRIFAMAKRKKSQQQRMQTEGRVWAD
jgi:hypothetical protein